MFDTLFARETIFCSQLKCEYSTCSNTGNMRIRAIGHTVQELRSKHMYPCLSQSRSISTLEHGRWGNTWFNVWMHDCFSKLIYCSNEAVQAFSADNSLLFLYLLFCLFLLSLAAWLLEIKLLNCFLWAMQLNRVKSGSSNWMYTYACAKTLKSLFVHYSNCTVYTYCTVTVTASLRTYTYMYTVRRTRTYIRKSIYM